MLKFYPNEHKYEDADNPKAPSISSSGLVELVTQPFDMEYWTRYKAYEELLFGHIKNLDKRKKAFRAKRRSVGMTTLNDYRLFDLLEKDLSTDEVDRYQEIYRERWRVENLKSTQKGSQYHDAKEHDSIKRGYEFNPYDKKDYPVIVAWKWEKGVKMSIVELDKLKTGYYPEIIVHYNGIWGQIDRLWVNAEERCFWIRDYKTNKEIKTTNKFQRMKSPLAHLEDCNFNHYNVQLSIYAWIIEKYGWECRGLAIDHYNQEYQMEYLKWDVENLILNYELNFLSD